MAWYRLRSCQRVVYSGGTPGAAMPVLWNSRCELSASVSRTLPIGARPASPESTSNATVGERDEISQNPVSCKSLEEASVKWSTILSHGGDHTSDRGASSSRDLATSGKTLSLPDVETVAAKIATPAAKFATSSTPNWALCRREADFPRLRPQPRRPRGNSATLLKRHGRGWLGLRRTATQRGARAPSLAAGFAGAAERPGLEGARGAAACC